MILRWQISCVFRKMAYAWLWAALQTTMWILILLEGVLLGSVFVQNIFWPIVCYCWICSGYTLLIHVHVLAIHCIEQSPAFFPITYTHAQKHPHMHARMHTHTHTHTCTHAHTHAHTRTHTHIHTHTHTYTHVHTHTCTSLKDDIMRLDETGRHHVQLAVHSYKATLYISIVWS